MSQRFRDVEDKRRDESRRGTHECARHKGLKSRYSAGRVKTAALLGLAACTLLWAQASPETGEFAVLMQQGQRAMQEQRMQDAELAFRGAVALEPLSAPALTSLAYVVYRSGRKATDRFAGSSRFDEAKQLFDKAISADPNNFLAHYDLATAIGEQCMPSLMQAYVDSGFLNSTNAILPFGPQRQALQKKIGGLLADGIGHSRRALEINPNSGEAMRQLSSLLKIRASIDDSEEGSTADQREARDWMRKANEQQAALGMPAFVRISSRIAEANLIERVDPVYPAAARAIRLQGTVEFTVVIDEQGHVADTTLVRGHPMLVNAARDALAHWVYRPTMFNGQAVKVTTTVDVVFRVPD
jgi:TonB family protein